ncbi:uncharacterized protein PV09_06795 [Verruconis gallopava]|uniref:DNA-directed RNA polymerases I, II, and III subunit RPABC3 n=1 Tax=Verruconis gallopava TaxID=253628 RepID=A0A0D2A5E7_9PEZI|nr:uncharacterized protein PV09_06795 [Verruconis gallopava]KIW01958.1 hypothetical protein PV09_06795 [Verruconis gallopava]
MATDAQLFISSFQLDTSPAALETQSKARYDRVTRYTALSTGDASIKLILDVNTDLYTLSPDTQFDLCLASTLNLDGTKDEGKSGGWREKQPGESDLSDGWDYVCYGKVYKFDEGKDGEEIKMYASFGGLLMYLEGPYRKLTSLRVDDIYLLIKK